MQRPVQCKYALISLMHGLLRQTAGRLFNKLANKKFGSTVGKDLVDALVAILPDNRLCAAYSKALDGLKVSRAARHRHSVVSPAKGLHVAS
jgi:hypothetical protein